jgi:hypothetical protein
MVPIKCSLFNKWIGDSLIKHPDFSLPGKKALLKDTDYELVLIDVTETQCERPKKSRNITIPVRKKNI